MTNNTAVATVIVFGDNRLPRGTLTKAACDRLEHLVELLRSESITHIFLSGGVRTRDAVSHKVLSEAFLMRRYVLSRVDDKGQWLPRITLEEDAVGTMNAVRETMTLVNRMELGCSPIIVIAQRLRLVHLRRALRAIDWDDIDYRECHTSWQTEKPCVQALRIVGAVFAPLGGAVMTLSANCRNRLVGEASRRL